MTVSMAEFPREFIDQPEILRGDLGLLGDAALNNLNSKGYEVATGLSRYYAGSISVMARQSHIVEYCPNDAAPSRFASEASTKKWLQKAGGRGVFLILEKVEEIEQSSDLCLAGYGWTGYEEMPAFEEYPVTSAYRLGGNALRKGLAGDFIQVIISATHALYSRESLGLETWLSNPAVRIYKKLGFFALEAVEELEEEWRPTLKPDAPAGKTRDKRLRMGYPDNRFA